MNSRNPTDWMWAQACDLLDQAERMQRQFFRLSTSERTQAIWEPPADVLEDEHEILVVIALPGVPPERVEVVHDAGDIVVRAQRPMQPLPGGTSAPPSRYAVRQLEIPYGYFERRIRLPHIRLEVGAPELSNGCLLLRLRKANETGLR